MGKLNFTTERINELFVKAQSMPEVADIVSKTFANSTYQPKGDYLVASAMESYATLAALETLTTEVTALKTALQTLTARFETMLGEGDVSAVIDSFNEMESFLNGVTNTKTLTGMLAELKAEIEGQIPTGVASQTDLTALVGRTTALETASATQATAISTLQTDMTKRPALPEDATQGIYAIENGSYAKIFNGDEVLFIE